MKLAKALYFAAFLLAINVLTPGSNNYVEAKPANSKKVTKGGDNAFIRKIKNNKVAFISTLAATIALAVGTTLGVMHFQKEESDNNPSSANKIPSIVARKNTNLISNNKHTPLNIKTSTKPSIIETNTKSTIKTNTKTSTIDNAPSTYRYQLRYL
ncbi:early transcribed membrane protein [Plasmodium berghei]|uniref:Early transcribed membrane protein n=2 Tax=Plasmodium berghei TaxID=5821 RepID=A0A509AGP4_PLABA|nr:early transcribed membrane protein [Plasmodium berghei ANKA]CAD12774.1 small exported protein 3 [Plasmodium berghei]CXI06560.1 early transcribed membrane protein [Plasmodium berghei]SCL92482.1 early transcribed membrane protein [Plasmodium berghei]SCM15646.1 early transcribed membrane protein [Plasmodium berghei]SCM17440.1 early transcribed membrane protein [Plasmodium berghei]|eukprot:XP_034420251.1 early transcribed membrane protein [Plasmodium berghei ANKA]